MLFRSHPFRQTKPTFFATLKWVLNFSREAAFSEKISGGAISAPGGKCCAWVLLQHSVGAYVCFCS